MNRSRSAEPELQVKSSQVKLSRNFAEASAGLWRGPPPRLRPPPPSPRALATGRLCVRAVSVCQSRATVQCHVWPVRLRQSVISRSHPCPTPRSPLHRLSIRLRVRHSTRRSTPQRTFKYEVQVEVPRRVRVEDRVGARGGTLVANSVGTRSSSRSTRSRGGYSHMAQQNTN